MHQFLLQALSSVALEGSIPTAPLAPGDPMSGLVLLVVPAIIVLALIGGLMMTFSGTAARKNSNDPGDPFRVLMIGAFFILTAIILKMMGVI